MRFILETKMEIIKSENAKSVTLSLIGKLDTVTAPELDKEIQACDAYESLVIDLEKLEYISSAGLRVLLSAHKAFDKKDGMIVKNANSTVMDIFEVTGFKDILTIA